MCFLVLSHSLSTVNRFPAYINRWLQIVLLPGKSHGRRSLVGCSPWGCKESDTTEVTSLSLFTFMHWTRKWQPIPEFLPGESHGQMIWASSSLWGCKESDMTEATYWALKNRLYLVIRTERNSMRVDDNMAWSLAAFNIWWSYRFQRLKIPLVSWFLSPHLF